MGFDLDLADIDPETADHGGFLNTAGWFRCVVKDVVEDNQKDQTILKFEVSAGPHRGCTTSYYLPNPETADDPKRAATRIIAVAKRLTLTSDAELNQLKSEGKHYSPDLYKAIGNEVWLEVTKSRSNNGGDYFGPSYMGIYPLNHERVPAEVRGVAPAKPAATVQPPKSNGANGQPNEAATSTSAWANF